MRVTSKSIRMILVIALLAWAAPMVCGAGSGIPEVIAHRGASADAPENTLAAAKLAWKQNADAVEIDVYLTTDRQIVLMHDGTTARTTGVSMKVSRSTLADLRTLDAGKWKGPQWKGEKIPTLAEVLKTVPDGKRLFIEIKCGGEIVPDLLKVLDVSGKDEAQIVIISFNADAIKEVELKRPSLKTYFLCSPNAGNIDKLLRTARVIRADGINGNAAKGFDQAIMEKIRQAGLGVYVWTVDDPATARKYAEWGVEGITTNKPGLIKALLKEK